MVFLPESVLSMKVNATAYMVRKRPWIFMQESASKKARCSLGGDRGDGITVESAKRSGPPFARVVTFGIGHAHARPKRREDERGRPKGLMSVDGKFIAEG
jgi:hypothetical protein